MSGNCGVFSTLLDGVKRLVPFRRQLHKLHEAVLVWRARNGAGRQFLRIKNECCIRPLRVLFAMHNLAKWKVQSLYDLMRVDDFFDPMVALTIMDVDCSATIEDKLHRISELQSYAAAHGMKYVDAYDPVGDRYIPFSEFSPDIVFYSMPGLMGKDQHPTSVSHYALTCYVPYFVPNYGGLDMDCGQLVHRLVWRYFALNKSWESEYRAYMGRRRAGEIVGLGHPMLDVFDSMAGKCGKEGYVIYAPHFSCGVFECYSTFMKNGMKMLDLARKHPEIKWLFKPHPTLRSILISRNLMGKREVDAYYAAWEKLGTVCYDGGYVEYFMKSRAIITDCASFLVEYACTGNPIIHLISSESKYTPHPISKKLFDSYYQAHDWDEFMLHFSRVVVGGADPLREERLSQLAAMKLVGNRAAYKICEYLKKELR